MGKKAAAQRKKREARPRAAPGGGTLRLYNVTRVHKAEQKPAFAVHCKGTAAP